MLFLRTPDGSSWRRHIRIGDGHRRRSRYYTDFLPTNHLPSPNVLRRTTVQQSRTHIELISTAADRQDTQGMAPDILHDPLQQERDAILQRIQQILDPECLEATQDIDRLLRDFEAGTVIAISDGSHFPKLNRAAGAWIVESRCRSQWILGSMTCPGSATDFNSFRSELVGLLGASITLQVLSKCTNSPQRLIIGCDGDAALATLTLPIDNINTNLKHWDLISGLHDIWKSLPASPLLAKVKGHQDNSSRPLTRLESMNVQMDALAKTTALSYPPRHPGWKVQNIGIPMVTLGGEPIVMPLQKTLYTNMLRDNLRQYLARKANINPRDIHWSAFTRARRSATLLTNIFVSKWISDTIPTGKILQRRRHSISSRCPRCNHWGEDRIHILTCWHVGATSIWEKGIAALQQILSREKTCPEIQHFFIQELSKYRRTPNTRVLRDYYQPWQVDLERTGWNNVLIGLLPNSLITRQQAYYTAIHSRKSGSVWAMHIIHQLWTITRNMWLGRCAALHQKSVINSALSAQLLDMEIEVEYDAGCQNLPVSIRKWFRPTKAQILSQSLQYKKGWLLIVKSVKESMEIADYSIFASSRSMRRWIGFKQ